MSKTNLFDSMQTCVVKVRKDGSLSPSRRVREQLRRRAGDEQKIVMRRLQPQDPLAQVRKILHSLVTPAEAERWLHAPLAIFEGHCPIDLINDGEPLHVIEILECLEEGSYV